MVIVRAKYLQLSGAIEVKEEEFVMGPGSHFSDLRAAVVKRHPSLAYVSMLAVIDGHPANPDTELRDKDEVDFLASPAGG